MQFFNKKNYIYTILDVHHKNIKKCPSIPEQIYADYTPYNSGTTLSMKVSLRKMALYIYIYITCPLFNCLI